MCANEQLLIAIHKNAEMGKNTLDKLLPESKGEIRAVLEEQLEEYKRIFMAADTLLKSMDGNDGGVPPMTKVMSDLMIEVQTLSDKTPAHLSEMVLKGIDLGIEEINSALNELQLKAKPETVNLANTLRTFLMRNKETLQRFSA